MPPFMMEIPLLSKMDTNKSLLDKKFEATDAKFDGPADIIVYSIIISRPAMLRFLGSLPFVAAEL